MQIDLILNRLYRCFNDLKATMDQNYKLTRPQAPKQVQSNKPSKTSITEKIMKKEQKMVEKESPGSSVQVQKKSDPEKINIKKVKKKSQPQMSEQEKELIRKRLQKERPKPPMNAFISYVKAQKDRIKNSSSVNLSIAQITAEASVQWKKLSQEEKQPYVKEYQQSHQQYLTKRDRFLKQNPILKKIKIKKMSHAGPKALSLSQLKPKKILQEQFDDDHLKILKSQESQISDSQSSVSSSSVSSSSISDSQQGQSVPNNNLNPEKQKADINPNINKQKISVNINPNKHPVNPSLNINMNPIDKQKQKSMIQKKSGLEQYKNQRPKYNIPLLDPQLKYTKQGYKRKVQLEGNRVSEPKMMVLSKNMHNQQQKQIQKHPPLRQQEIERQKEFQKQKIMLQQKSKEKQRQVQVQEQRVKSDAKQKMLSMLSKKMDNVKVDGNPHVNPRLSSSDSGNI